MSKTSKPIFFNLSQAADKKKLDQLIGDNPQLEIIDTYDDQLKEYFTLQNPWLHMDPPETDKQFKAYRKEHYKDKAEEQAGLWVYLPWRHVVLHILEDKKYQQVRTGRNRNLITPEEQEKFYNSTIGIAGLSVGNSVALALVLTGGAKHIKLADPDTLELTNLNRIRGSIAELTHYKVRMTARQIYELDPYAKIELFTDGLTEKNIDKFFKDLDIVIDEIDNLGMKIRIRQEAKKHKIPVLMAADNGDSGVLDVERHDLDNNIPLFHGRAGKDIAKKVLNKKLPLPEIGRIIGEELIGMDIVEPRMQNTLLDIGSKIPTWPQLGNAAVLNGVAVATAARKILTNQPLVKNRAVLSMSSWLIPNYDSPAKKKSRAKFTKKFLKKYHELIKKFS